MNRVLVTGGSGFIGTNVVQDLLDEGYAVRNVDVHRPRDSRHHVLWRSVDILDAGRLRSELRAFAPDYVVHMAARTDLRGKASADYRQNVEGIANLITALEAVESPKRVLFASTMLVCRLGYIPAHDRDYCPSTPYGESKMFGEKLVREKAGDRFPWSIVRPTSIWGPWFGVPYRSFFEAVRRGLYVHPRGLRVRRSYGFVGNTAYQIRKLLTCAQDEVHGKTFYLADYEPLELRAWAESVRSAFDAPPIRDVPVPLLKAAARVGDALSRLGLPMPMTTFRLNNMMTDAIFDMAALQRICGPLPFSTAVAVRHTVDWMSHRDPSGIKVRCTSSV